MKRILMAILVVIVLITCIGKLYADNTAIGNYLPAFDDDVKGMKWGPLIVYNSTSQGYETVYIVTDSSGNLTVNTGINPGLTNNIVSGKTSVTAVLTLFRDIIDYSFLTIGGEVSITGNCIDTTLYVPDGYSDSGAFTNPVENAIFTLTLPASTTCYYRFIAAD